MTPVRIGFGGPGPQLPTYATVADFLEKKNGSGIRLVGWTIARSALIIPPMLLVGVNWKKAVLGGLLASGLISILTLVRVHSAAEPLPAMPLPLPTLPPPPAVPVAPLSPIQHLAVPLALPPRAQTSLGIPYIRRAG